MSITHAPAKPLLIWGVPIAFVILWATGFVISRLIAGHVAPLLFLAIRFPLAGIGMLALALAQRAPWPNAKGAFHASMAGILLHAIYLIPVYWAVAHGLPGGISALFVALQPFFTAFFAAPMLGEKVGPRHWLGLVIGLMGVAMVLAPKLSFDLLGGITPLTAGLGVLGVAGAALGSVYQKRFASGLPLTTSGVWQYVGAGSVAMLAALASRDFTFDNSPQAWWGMAWAVVILSIGTVLLLMAMINAGQVSRVSTWLFLEPAITAVMTYYMFGETLTVLQLIGMGVCAVAVLMVQFRRT